MTLLAAVRWDDGVFAEDAEPSMESRLQRICVRLSFDPEFVARVWRDPHTALRDLHIPPALIEQLLTNDPRAFTADASRRLRALKVLFEEFQGSTALILSRTGKFQSLLDFFSSDHFHSCVQHRGYMALAFRDHLADLLTGFSDAGSGTALLELEGSRAFARRCLREWRRGRDPAGRGRAGRELVVSPGVCLVRLPNGTLETLQHLERYLFEVALVPAVALCKDAPRPEPLPPLGQSREAWLLEPDDTGSIGMSGVEEPFASIIEAAHRPRSDEGLFATVRAARSDFTEPRLREATNTLLEARVLRRY